MCTCARRTDGFALAMSMLVGALLFLVAGLALHTAVSVGGGQAAGGDAEVAWWLARSGLLRAQRELSEGPDWGTGDPVETAMPPEGRYAVRVSRRQVNFNDVWLVTSVGHKGLASRRLVAVVRPDAFSRYSFVTNEERTSSGDPIWFTGKDDLHGPLFTNDRFHMYGAPRFRGTVGSMSDHYVHRTADGTEAVREGETSSLPPPPDLQQGFRGDQPYEETLRDGPGRDASMAEVRSWAAGGGRVLVGDHRITLQGTTLLLQPLAGGPPESVEVGSLPSRVIYVEGRVEVQGTLDGRLTLGSDGDMTITGRVDYRFRGDPEAAPDDMLGLVSRGDVVLARDVPDDMNLDASVLALGDEFYYAGNGYAGNPRVRKGTLTISGGISQVRRGVIGLFNSSGTVAGFDKDYRYDARLSSQAPPHFPNLVQHGRRRLVTVAIRDMQSLGAQP